MKKHIILLAIAFLSFHIVNAQTHTGYNNVWLHYSGKNMLTDKLSITLEGTMRFANGFDQKQQWFIRPSVDYQFTKHFMGSVGYTHYGNFVYGSPSLFKMEVPEDHAWLQIFSSHQLGNLKITNRLRNEFRFVGIPDATNTKIASYDFRNRVRYMLMFNYPLIKREDKSTALFALAGDEVFVNINQSAKTLLQQNRIIAGFGYNLNKHHQVQLAYIHQTIINFPNTIEENNETVRLSYITNFSFAKKG